MQKETKVINEVSYIVCQSIGIPRSIFEDSRKTYMKPECPHRIRILGIQKMSRQSMQRMRATLTGEEMPKLVEIAKERSYELYQLKYDTQLEVLSMLLKLKDQMERDND